ncbi:MAG: hypothetical protein J5802_13430 [Butyrivibrio sp.]|nr:hypothetical protein [Butyrivibrio sp.]
MNSEIIFISCMVIVGVIILSAIYILIVLAKNSRKTLQEDMLGTDVVKYRTAQNNLRGVKVAMPITIVLAVIYIIVLLNHFLGMIPINPIGGGLFAGGLLFTYLGVFIKKLNTEKKGNYLGVCKGIVVDVRKSTELRDMGRFMHPGDGTHVDYFVPVVRYVVNGTEYIVECSSAKDLKNVPKVGTELTVYYDTQCPNFMETDFDRSVSGPVSIVFVSVGILLTVVGLIVCIVFRPWY